MRASLLKIFSWVLGVSLYPIQVSSQILSESEFKTFFGTRIACFVITDLKTGKTVSEYNPKRCRERLSPCSTFKIAAAVMAFDKGVFKDVNQVVKWDGIKRARIEVNRDLTPLTWMSESAKWVTDWIMPQLGFEAVKQFLAGFAYGNQDFNGGMKNSWVMSSLKVSAYEQIEFLRRLWNHQLPVSLCATAQAKELMLIKKIGTNSELYGKTGTGCLEDKTCMDRPGKMLGWFVGVVKSGSKEYAFAANGSDRGRETEPAGSRMRKTTIGVLEKMGLLQK